MATHRAVVLRGRGGLDQLEVRELPLVEPGPGEVRIRVRASGAGATDLIMRTGSYPFAPPYPFSPGYDQVRALHAGGDPGRVAPILRASGGTLRGRSSAPC